MNEECMDEFQQAQYRAFRAACATRSRDELVDEAATYALFIAEQTANLISRKTELEVLQGELDYARDEREELLTEIRQLRAELAAYQQPNWN